MVVFMIKLNQMSNKLKNCTNQLSKDLKRRVYSLFKDNICGPDLVDMHLISKFNKRTSFLLCVIDTFRKYAQVVLLKDKKGITIVLFKRFYIIQRESQKKIWVNKRSGFYK